MTLLCWLFSTSPNTKWQHFQWWLLSPGVDSYIPQARTLTNQNAGGTSLHQVKCVRKYTWHHLQRRQVWRHQDRQFSWQFQNTHVSEAKLERAGGWGGEVARSRGIRSCLRFWRKLYPTKRSRRRSHWATWQRCSKRLAASSGNTQPGKGPRGSCVSAYENPLLPGLQGCGQSRQAFHISGKHKGSR